MQTHFSARFCYNLKGSLKLWSLSRGDPLLYNIYSYQSISICFQAVQYQEQSNLASLLLIKSQNREEPLDLGELMKFPLLPVPPSLGTQDGFFSKTNKAAILHYPLEDLSSDDLPYPQDALFIQDGMALFHTLTNLPPTCGEICLQVLDQMAVKKNFIFSTDSYHENSIKAQERLRRGSSERILLAGPATRKPFDFKVFLENDENKNLFTLCCYFHRLYKAMINTYLHFPGRVERASAALQ